MAATSASSLAVFDIRNYHVLVQKSMPDTGTHPHTISYIHGDLSLYFNPNSNTAFLKLRLSAIPEDNVFVYLHVHPEHITKLVQDRSNDTNPAMAQLCKSSARGSVSLRFILDKPGEMIGPPDWPLLADKVKKEALDDIHIIAAQTTLLLHVPHGAVSPSQVGFLCLAASSKGMLSLNALQASVRGMYAGRGGEVIDLPDTAIQTVESPAVPPPAYGALAGPSQPHQEAENQPGQSRKRRRESSGTPTATASPTPEAEVETGAEANVAVPELSEHLRDQMQRYIDELCNESMAKREAKFRKEVFMEMERMEARIQADVAEQVEHMTETITDEVADRFNEHLQYGDVVSRDELEEVIDDKLYGIKVDLEDFVKDELVGAKDDVLEHFESGSWQFSTV